MADTSAPSPHLHAEGLTAPAEDLDFYVAGDPIFGPSSDTPWEPSKSSTAPDLWPGPAPTSSSPRSPHSAPAAPAPPPSRAFWTLPFWQQFFQVNTADVLSRVRSSLWPLQPPEYLAAKRLGYLAYLTQRDLQSIEAEGLEVGDIDVASPPGNPHSDLYGPVWVSCTFWLTLAIVAHMAQAFRCGETALTAGCQRGWFSLMAAAGGVIAAYQLGVPLGLWLIMRWQGVPVGLVDTLCLYGYSLFVFIPAALLCAIPWPWVQWPALGLAFAVSGLHIVGNLYGVWKQSLAPKWFLLVMGGCVGLHAVLILVLKVAFL